MAMVGSVGSELRLALRSLARQPGFLVLAVLTLALGVGSVSAIFSVVNGVLLKPLPYPDAERIVRINKYQPPFTGPVSRFVVADWREGSREVYSALAAFHDDVATLTGSGEPERLAIYRVSPEFWEVMGLAPLHGRYFGQDAERSNERVAVISHAFWQRRFAGDPEAVGSQLVLDGVAYQVVGVTPSVFRYPANTELYLPTYLPSSTRGEGNSFLSVIARLAPGVSVEQADAVLESINVGLAERDPPNHTNLQAQPVALPELLTSGVREPLLILLGASALVLLIACANLANLLLARGSQRQRELAVRAALGAGRRRLLRTVLAEALLIAAMGGALGIAIAWAAVPLLLASAPQLLPSHSAPGVDGMVVGASLALSLATVLVFGLFPALRAGRVQPAGALQEEGRGGSGGRGRARARSALVALEVALSLTLLVGAGLLIESLRRVGEVDVGVDPAQVLVASIVLPSPPEVPGEDPDDTWQRLGTHYAARTAPLLERLGALPGVRRVGLADSVPMGGGSTVNSSITIAGRDLPTSSANLPWAMWRFANHDYFTALGIPLRRGRLPQDTDVQPGQWPSTIVVNETFVERYLGDVDPIGQQVGNVFEGPPKTIVGVVADTRLFGRENDAPPEVYLPVEILPMGPRQFALQVDGDPAALVEPVRRALREAGGQDMPVLSVQPMSEVLSSGTELREFNLRLMLVFSVVALGLAAIGLYAVIAYSVAQRRQELGIRMSLGADAGRVVGLVLGQGMRLVLAGLVLGVGGALLLGRVLSAQLFGIASGDPWVILSVSVVLALVAVLACLVPAWRAARVPPMEALGSP